jgi:hypothetical protein
MKAGLLLMGFVLMTGCAGVSEKEREEREYSEVEWLAEYGEFRRRCLNNRGIIVVQASNRLHRKPAGPAPGDQYSCQRTLAIR